MFLDKTSLPFVKVLEDNVEVIKAELKAVAPELFMPWPYYPVKDWNVFGFKFHCKDYEANMELCPQTMEILRSSPLEISTAGFSSLGPLGMISPHAGDSVDCEITCHLGLVVPPRSFLKSGDELKQYEQDKCLVFDDGPIHLAWNEHHETRTTLMIRFIKPERDFRLAEIDDRMLNVMTYKNKRFYRERHGIQANAS